MMTNAAFVTFDGFTLLAQLHEYRFFPGQKTWTYAEFIKQLISLMFITRSYCWMYSESTGRYGSVNKLLHAHTLYTEYTCAVLSGPCACAQDDITAKNNDPPQNTAISKNTSGCCCCCDVVDVCWGDGSAARQTQLGSEIESLTARRSLIHYCSFVMHRSCSSGAAAAVRDPERGPMMQRLY